MDPASIVGLVGAATGLIYTCGKITKDLHDLKERYNDTSSTLRSTVLECRTLSAAVMQIQAWIEDLSPRRRVEERLQPIHHAIVDFQASLDPLHEDVTTTLDKANPLGDLPRKIMFSVIWNEAKMKDHLDSVRWQANAMHLLLNSTQLPRLESIRKMEGIARAVSSFRDGSLFQDSGSSIDDTDFDFDDELVNSAAYRRVLRSHQRHPSSNTQGDSASTSSTIQGTLRRTIVKDEALEVEIGDLIDFSQDDNGSAIGWTPIQTPTVYSEDIKELMHLSLLEVETSQSLRPELPTARSLTKEEQSFGKRERWVRRRQENGPEFYQNNLTKQKATFVKRELSTGSAYTGFDDHSLPGSQCWIWLKSEEGQDFCINTKTAIMPTAVSQEARSRGEIVTDLDRGRTDLMMACLSEDDTTLRNLLADQDFPFQGIMARDLYCWTTLHTAADSVPASGSKIILLLEAGADIDAITTCNRTPLMLAVQCGDLDAVKALVTYGADRNLQNTKGQTPLDVAVVNGHAQIISALLQDIPHQDHPSGDPERPYIYTASTAGNVEVLEALFDGQRTGDSMQDWISRINTKTSEGNTVLYEVTRSNHLHVVKFLLGFGAQKIVNVDEWTPLHIACGFGFLDIVKEFAKYNFDLSLKLGSDGSTPLHLAAFYGHTEVAEFLLKCGQKQICRNNGMRPLHDACKNGHAEVAEVLLNYGADIDGTYISKEESWTWKPLARAIHFNQVSTIELLLSRGASLSNVRGEYSALEYACLEQMVEVTVLESIWSFQSGRNIKSQPFPASETEMKYGNLLYLLCINFECSVFRDDKKLFDDANQNVLDKTQLLILGYSRASVPSTRGKQLSRESSLSRGI